MSEDLADALRLWTTVDPYAGFPSCAIGWRLLPALEHGHYRLYRDIEGCPVGFVTWAFMTREEYETGVYYGPEVFARKDGELLVFADMIAPYGRNDVLFICRDLQKIFKELYPGVETAVARRGQRTGVFPQKGG